MKIKYIITLIILTIGISASSELIKNLTGKKILMIIAPSDFRDEEYQKPKELFEKAGAKITVAASSLNISIRKPPYTTETSACNSYL